MAEIVVTPGEKALINALTEINAEFITENLLISDICIRVNNDPVYIFERKAKTDLDASIKDGRYREQKARMLKTGVPRQRIIYIIEDLKVPRDAPGKKRVWSAMCNSLVRDSLSVFRTGSPKETAEFLQAMAESINKHPLPTVEKSNDNSNESIELTTNIKKKRVAADEWFQTSLTLIHGLSPAVAEVIASEYPSFSALSTASVKDIAELKRPGGTRKVGKQLASRVCEFIAENFA